MKLKKCHLLQLSVTFLGHVMSAGTVGVDPIKVRDAEKWPVHVTFAKIEVLMTSAVIIDVS